MAETKETTPMFQQYAEQKRKHKDAVLFFRMGDFYEMFKSDAIEISRLLNLTLTHRQGIPMCGIPYHAASNYIGRLLKLGKKIAICEQIELPQNGKGLAKREVIEVVTPGTVVDDRYLDDSANNYLAAVAGDIARLAFAYIDLSTGEFRATVLEDVPPRDGLRRELACTSPRELIIQESLLESSEYSFLIDEDIVIDRMPDWYFDYAASAERLTKQFGTVNLKAFGLKSHDPRIPVSGSILEYLEDKHHRLLPHISSLQLYGNSDSMGLDESTIKNLELVRNLQDGSRSFTLLDTLDHTKTAPGARLLRKRILQPFSNIAESISHHERVDRLYHDQSMLSALRDALSSILDMERLAARSAMDKAHAKDLIAIRDSLKKCVKIRTIVDVTLLDDGQGELNRLFDSLAELAEYLQRSLMEDPSILLNEGRLIRAGWNTEVDRMRLLRDEGHSLLNAYVAEEKAATGIGSLKLKYNRILGYFLEISKIQSEAAPSRFRRRQSLAQVERFSTDRLDKLENEISSVGERLVEQERKVFLVVRARVKEEVPRLMRAALIVANIDVVQSFAHAATEYGYVRPRMVEEPLTDIVGGRHPVVEHHMPHGSFVPNSVHLSGEKHSFALVTGPNMAGKSTVLRQVALLTLMAQIGSYIPADSAVIGVADRIFCRVGASDNLARGESTFLVEMNETANILRNASFRSLVIMDEVGRGTGTADGLAIARAVCEYLLENPCPRTLFATHYRELTHIKHPKMMNLSMAVREVGNDVVFTKNLVAGAAEASYGIHVGALAGLPSAVVSRAKELLDEYERYSLPEKTAPQSHETSTKPTTLFNPSDLMVDLLRGLDIDSITPLESLKILARWKEELGSDL